MTPNGTGASRAPRRTLRYRLAALVAGPGIFPLALAVLLLFPIFRRDILDAQGATLAREATLLATEVEVYLRSSPDRNQALTAVAGFRKGDLGRAYLYDDAGGRIAGPVDLPTPPAASAALPESGWMTFERQKVSYMAGLARVHGPGQGAAQRGSWILAVIQPEDEVLAPLYKGVELLAIFFFGICALSMLFSWRLAEVFLVPIRKLRQGAEIISHANLSHRIDIRTGDELEALARDFNRMAESLQRSYGELEERVRDTTRHLSEERNRLAAVLQTMTEGVIMASQDGRVVLITPRARLALGSKASTGIGAPLAGLLPPDRLDFHLRRIRRARTEGRDGAEEVSFPLADGRRLRGTLTAVPGPSGELAGFLFVFRDQLAAARDHAEAVEALRMIPSLLKGPAATLRSLVDVMQTRPDMAEDRRKTFRQAIREEVTRLTERLETAEAAALDAESSHWPAVHADPGELLTEAVAGVPGVALSLEAPPDRRPWIRVEPYSWVQSLSAMLQWIRKQAPAAPIEARLTVEEDAVVTTLRTEGVPMNGADLEGLVVAPGGEEGVPLGEAVRRNRGELWTRRSGGGFEVRLAVVGTALDPERATAATQSGPPAFYDFDLFLPHPSTEPGDLLSTPLDELEYVVFDTETTGLNPSQGDEVVSLSAVRIRRGRVAPGDVFDTLVKPSRPIPPESKKFHGIDDAMVEQAPSLAEVLPQFRDYAGDAVLVAHNAAFDKKFLDLAAERHRQPVLENPVLDTLFLSYGMHGNVERHSLDAIAQRLGVEIRDRHTSLGDASATAEILLGLLPLLAERGVSTLGDAKAFCDKMLLFRWRTSRF